MAEIWIAQTTVETAEAAATLARQVVAERLAACVQVDGPIRSHYVWEGSAHEAEEYRLTFKASPGQILDLGARVEALHPFDVPEWVAWRAEASPAYGAWAAETG